MFKRLRRSLLVLIAAATFLVPGSALAERYQEHSDHVLVQVGVGPGYHYRHCRGGYYDRWGHWHPYRCW
jgi:hypothetical protein